MKRLFYKYQGAGNDFIIIDNRANNFPKENRELISKLCNRRFGIGADGLILLENRFPYHFAMVYFNADGREGSMCGNGARCIVAFANFLKIIQKQTRFIAIDGSHYAKIDKGQVSIKMNDVTEIKNESDDWFLDTGSPHYIRMVEEDLHLYDVFNKGKAIAHGKLYEREGSNVNFVKQVSENSFDIRTYERGVEKETLACGTGAVAVALAMHYAGKTKSNKVIIQVQGGILKIDFKCKKGVYSDIYLTGPALQVYKGKIEV